MEQKFRENNRKRLIDVYNEILALYSYLLLLSTVLLCVCLHRDATHIQKIKPVIKSWAKICFFARIIQRPLISLWREKWDGIEQLLQLNPAIGIKYCFQRWNLCVITSRFSLNVCIPSEMEDGISSKISK